MPKKTKSGVPSKKGTDSIRPTEADFDTEVEKWRVEKRLGIFSSGNNKVELEDYASGKKSAKRKRDYPNWEDEDFNVLMEKLYKARYEAEDEYLAESKMTQSKNL